jgi:hypothetical protein
MTTPTATAALVSALSVMLAAYGFLYNAVKGGLDAAKAIDHPAANAIELNAQRQRVKSARNTACVLTLAPLLVWGLFLSQLIAKIDEAADDSFALRDYSTLDTALVVLINVWLIIALFVGWQANELRRSSRDFK